ncbi:Protein O-linked-mannose beta-1,2-N-acetylglucosaminyltransferase 1 [Armadillidium vulgare]|nr:Protein O-linked-mannose beta-1,2-N-acetylglucosaminyltransferase 1 [Armadillidium vulgare]
MDCYIDIFRQITYVINPTENLLFPGKGGRIASHYKFSLKKSFEMFPSSKLIIVLEEDILTSPNFISYFNQTSKVLAKDPSLYCINAWNDLSAMHTGGDVKIVHRTETLPAYGWMITREFFEEVYNVWFESNKNFDWDIWFRGPTVRATRECLVPEISRSFHLGESGVHIRGQMTLAHMMGHLSTGKKDITIENIDRLTQKEYEEDIYQTLESDNVVFEKTMVVFFWMESTQDSSGWYRLSSCLGIFNMDTRNNHRGLFRFYFYNTRIFAIGYPFSDYR